jgi:hypothetical protein
MVFWVTTPCRSVQNRNEQNQTTSLYLAWLNLRPCRWRRCVPPKRRAGTEDHAHHGRKDLNSKHGYGGCCDAISRVGGLAWSVRHVVPLFVIPWRRIQDSIPYKDVWISLVPRSKSSFAVDQLPRVRNLLMIWPLEQRDSFISFLLRIGCSEWLFIISRYGSRTRPSSHYH